MSECRDCDNKHNGRKEDWAHLTTVSNDIEFNIVKGLLETAEIPAVRKVKGIDGLVEIVIGVPIAGIEILVPVDRLEEAEQLLNAQVEEDPEGINEE